MKFTALVMAGGKGSRISGEKAIVKVGGISMLSRVVRALRNSTNIKKIILTTSSHSPKTSDEAHKLGLEVLITPGTGYVEDMKYAVSIKNLGHVLVINSDLPFINASIIDQVIGLYREAEKPALAVMVPAAKWKELGFEATYTTRMGNETVAPVGLNVINGKRVGNDEVEEEVVIMRDVLPFINVNNVADIETAERLLRSMPQIERDTSKKKTSSANEMISS